ncbi:MAG TPA: type II toxin-antitoxin system VapC family toxin [Blastocatellia bacterium]|nr:type II toxin-antitoxin system VapC family toxin [Blastocatellia bacterium]
MSYLVDTNVLLRGIQKDHPMHKTADYAVKTLLNLGEELFVTLQNLIEFWAVATRPLANNGLELSIEQAYQELGRLKRIFPALPETPDILTEWERIVIQYRVSGKQAHDARIAAAMIVHGVKNLLTFNTDDFKRYSDIAAINPHSITAP